MTWEEPIWCETCQEVTVHSVFIRDEVKCRHCPACGLFTRKELEKQ